MSNSIYLACLLYPSKSNNKGLCIENTPVIDPLSLFVMGEKDKEGNKILTYV